MGLFEFILQAYFRDIAGLAPDHGNRVNITIKRVTQIFWFPGTCKSYVYTILQSIKCAVALCLKKSTTLIKKYKTKTIIFVFVVTILLQ